MQSSSESPVSEDGCSRRHMHDSDREWTMKSWRGGWGPLFLWGWWLVLHLTPRCPRDTEYVNTEHPLWLEREPSLVLEQGQGASLISYRWEPPDPLTTTGQGTPKSLWSGQEQLPSSGPFILSPTLQEAPRAPAEQSGEQTIPFRCHKLQALNRCTSCCVPWKGCSCPLSLSHHGLRSPGEELAPTAGPSQLWARDPSAS